MKPKTLFLALTALMALSPSLLFAQSMPLMADTGNCIYTVTPSSITSQQVNGTTLNGGRCTDYKQVCFTLDDTSTQRVFVSTFNASVAPAGTITAVNVFPVVGGVPGYCFDWARNVAIWVHMKATQVPVANSLSVMFSK